MILVATPYVAKNIAMGIYGGYKEELFQQRHQTDRQVNNRKSQVLRKGYLVEEKWHRVQVNYQPVEQIQIEIKYLVEEKWHRVQVLIANLVSICKKKITLMLI